MMTLITKWLLLNYDPSKKPPEIEVDITGCSGTGFIIKLNMDSLMKSEVVKEQMKAAKNLFN